MAEDGPKWILGECLLLLSHPLLTNDVEHAVSNKAICNQASCKSGGVKIQTGELRIGTHTLFNGDGESRMYYAWRHW